MSLPLSQQPWNETADKSLIDVNQSTATPMATTNIDHVQPMGNQDRPIQPSDAIIFVNDGQQSNGMQRSHRHHNSIVHMIQTHKWILWIALIAVIVMYTKRR